jgi:hypothetical protein
MKPRTLIFRRLARDCEGGVLILVGVGLVILVAAAGAGIDFGLQSLARGKLQAAADLAATSAGGYENPDGSTATAAQRQAVGDRFYQLNFRNDYMGVPAAGTPGNPANVTLVSGNTITVTPTPQTINTGFISHVGTSELSVGAASMVGITSATTAQAHDVLLLMDTSGSMLSYPAPPYANRLIAAKVAAIALANTLLPPSNNLLPVSQRNRVGVVSWGGAVNGVPLLPTSDKALVEAAINNLALGNGTNSTSGLTYAAVNAPFNNLAAVKTVILMTDGGNNMGPMPNGQIWPYQDPNADNLAIYPDNGPAKTWLTTRNFSPGNTINSLYPNYPNFLFNSQSLARCSQLKQQDVVLYTVGFGSGEWSPQDTLQPKSGIAIRNFLSSCATNGGPVPYTFSGLYPYNYPTSTPIEFANTNYGTFYYLADNGSQLVNVFTQIANQIKNVRIQQ